MTLKDFLNSVTIDDMDKMIVFRDNQQVGWGNIKILKNTKTTIEITTDSSPISDKS